MKIFLQLIGVLAAVAALVFGILSILKKVPPAISVALLVVAMVLIRLGRSIK